MIIILSSEHVVKNESRVINRLFEQGLPLFHIRKYTYSCAEITAFVTAIAPVFRSRLVLHTHHQLAEELGINRLHINEKEREKESDIMAKHSKYMYSTSVHSIDDFNQLEDSWAYAFLSPIFSSISKPGYVPACNMLASIRQKKNNKVRLIGLGGIYPDNAQQVLEAGADGIALLGSIWCGNNPLETFVRCKK